MAFVLNNTNYILDSRQIPGKFDFLSQLMLQLLLEFHQLWINTEILLKKKKSSCDNPIKLISIKWRHCLLAMYQPETLSKPNIASPCETLRENCRKEQEQVQERCKTEEVQVKVLHRKVLEALHTLLSSLRKSPTQRPCLEELHHSFKFIFV